MQQMHPIRLQASFHETIWGGKRLALDGWKPLANGEVLIGEAWETETSTIAQNEPYTGKTLGELVKTYGEALLGKQAIDLYGPRFPLLAKFIDANAKLSVQVHPNDQYAAEFEAGKLGKTECWYILDAAPGASIIHGFISSTTREHVRAAIESFTLESLLEVVPVSAGDVIFVPAGTVHAIGEGVMLYELQEYSDLTYRMYDYGRLTAAGMPRELHIERSLDVSHYYRSPRIKAQPVELPGTSAHHDRCLVACRYFVLRELTLGQGTAEDGYMNSETGASCVILTSLDAPVQIRYGVSHEGCLTLARGQTAVLPAALGAYCVEGRDRVLLSYVPAPGDEAWQAWEKANR